MTGFHATSPSLPAAERPRTSRGLIVVAGLAAIALGVGGTLFAVRSRGEPPAPASTQVASAPPPPVVTGAPTPPTVTTLAGPMAVTLVARPAEAKIFLDDAPVTYPFVLKVPKDGSSHNLRAEARGYVTRSMVVTFDSEKEIVLSLDRIAGPQPQPPPVTVTRPAPAAAAPPHVAAVPAPAPAAAPGQAEIKAGAAPTKKTPRGIDSTNLWER